MKTSHNLMLGALTLAMVTLPGCGGGGGSSSGQDPVSETPNTGSPVTETPVTDPGYKNLVVNATDSVRYSYLNLESGQVLNLTDAEAAASTDWHVALRRTAIKLNGGVSGPGTLAGAVVADQADFYDSEGNANASVFLNATADSELEHLLADHEKPASFTTEALTTALVGSGNTVGTNMDMGWYLYDFTTHALSPNPDTGWMLRGGEGTSYSRVHSTALTYSSAAGLDVTFEFDVQPVGASEFTTTATFNAIIPATGGEICFDADTDSQVDCSGTAWDLKAGVSGRSLYLRSNGGVSGSGNGAAFGSLPWSDLLSYGSGNMAPDGTSLARVYVQDSTSGIFAESLWYGYNLDNTHKLHPNYRVYWITTDSTNPDAAGYLLQVTGYYDDAGTSGYLDLRWRAAQ